MTNAMSYCCTVWVNGFRDRPIGLTPESCKGMATFHHQFTLGLRVDDISVNHSTVSYYGNLKKYSKTDKCVMNLMPLTYLLFTSNNWLYISIESVAADVFWFKNYSCSGSNIAIFNDRNFHSKQVRYFIFLCKIA